MGRSIKSTVKPAYDAGSDDSMFAEGAIVVKAGAVTATRRSGRW